MERERELEKKRDELVRIRLSPFFFYAMQPLFVHARSSARSLALPQPNAWGPRAPGPS